MQTIHNITTTRGSSRATDRKAIGCMSQERNGTNKVRNNQSFNLPVPLIGGQHARASTSMDLMRTSGSAKKGRLQQFSRQCEQFKATIDEIDQPTAHDV